ncbi:MAG: HINT domain-containing protein [Zoogloeaceae bacterium]|nr:HINT domain-containing protein [Zoogloeaceae bacterium]
MTEEHDCIPAKEAVNSVLDKVEYESNCFGEETFILCENECFHRIEHLSVGDKVLSRCEATGEMAYKRIIKIHQALGTTRHLYLNHSPTFEYLNRAIFVTDEHPFWVEGKGWTKVRDLEEGDELLTYNGACTSVETLFPSHLDCQEIVYNLEVEDFHTYFVDLAGIWVHNTNCAEKVANKETALERSIENQLAREKLPCFVAGTLVHTKDGKKPIEKIKVGDWVLSYPDDQVPPSHIREEHEYTYRQVTRTFVHEDKPVCEVTIMNFASNFKETLKVTLDHPFYVSNRGWIPAGELNFMCPLEAKNFGNLATGMPSATGEQARVYNLEVDEFHTYYVGCLGAWVHNACSLKNTKLPPLREITSAELPPEVQAKAKELKDACFPGDTPIRPLFAGRPHPLAARAFPQLQRPDPLDFQHLAFSGAALPDSGESADVATVWNKP